MNERRNSTPRTALAARLRGFTVTELVVVVAVIAVVIAIVIPTVGKVRASARTVKCLSNQRQVTLACYAYAMANSSKLINPRTDYGGMAYVDGANLSMSAAGWKHVFVRALNETGHTGVVTLNGRQYETTAAITTSVLFPYLGDIQVFISPDEPTNPAAVAASGAATRIRSYSLNACLGTTRPDELQEFDTPFTATTTWGPGPMLSQYNTTSIGTIKSPARMMSTIVEDDDVNYNNQGWLILPNTANWIDWPASWRPDAITMSYVDGSTESYALANKNLPALWAANGHRYQQPADPAAGFAIDWKYFRDRLNPGVIPQSTYGFSSN
jgi:prepilin-type N-terminal cleavage/methylation domain-containing protein